MMGWTDHGWIVRKLKGDRWNLVETTPSQVSKVVPYLIWYVTHKIVKK